MENELIKGISVDGELTEEQNGAGEAILAEGQGVRVFDVFKYFDPLILPLIVTP